MVLLVFEENQSQNLLLFFLGLGELSEFIVNEFFDCLVNVIT